ncbi:MAG TPA: hypothetical protein VFJ19_15825 [Nocardioidaceae bacterium]|nr:hypothetical protein [Nocardioidaceae bacterium]
MNRERLNEVEQFFVDFEQASQREHWERYADMFLPQFMNMDPDSCVTVARDDLIAFLPERKKLFVRAGAAGTALQCLDAEPMDQRHVLARTTWTVQFTNKREPAILRSTFVMRREDRWRIASTSTTSRYFTFSGSRRQHRPSDAVPPGGSTGPEYLAWLKIVFPVITGRTGQDRIYDDYPDVSLDMISSRTFDGRIQLLEYVPEVLAGAPGATVSGT